MKTVSDIQGNSVFGGRLAPSKQKLSVSKLVVSVLMLLFAGMNGYGVAEMGIVYAIPIMAMGIGIPLIIYSCYNMHVGMYLTFVMSFFILGVLRFLTIPLGLLMDGLILVFLIVTLVQVGSSQDWSDFKNPVTAMVLLWIFYNLAQVGNPVATSSLAWMYTIRGMAGALVFYFICLHAIKSFAIINTFIQMWIVFSLMLGAYAIFQEFHGLFPFEEQWVRADEERFNLLYNWGHFRKFSFFSDPTTFGITVAYTALLCIVLSLGPVSIFMRIYYLGCAAVMAFSMIFSGTRTAYVLIPIGIMFLTVLTLQRSFLIFSFVFFAAGAAVVLLPFRSIGPLNENALTRLRSAFIPGDDPSFQVRLKNQAFIKPYIQTHPIGAGLGTVGDWGTRFSPESPLAGFPPDSGFVKIAVELGWIGIILYSILLFVVLKVGIRNYYLITNPLHKNVQAGLLCVIIGLIAVNYAQEAITMYPTSIIVYAIMAMVTLMPKLDPHYEN